MGLLYDDVVYTSFCVSSVNNKSPSTAFVIIIKLSLQKYGRDYNYKYIKINGVQLFPDFG